MENELPHNEVEKELLELLAWMREHMKLEKDAGNLNEQQYAEMWQNIEDDIEMVNFRAEERSEQHRMQKLTEAMNDEQKQTLAKEIAEGLEEDARLVRYRDALRLIQLKAYGFSGN